MSRADVLAAAFGGLAAGFLLAVLVYIIWHALRNR
jgi:tetrahydromethanopterin S-methyltransferase subunit F